MGTETAHTPGPWKVSESEPRQALENGVAQDTWSIYSEKGDRICCAVDLMAQENTDGYAQFHANARLIAAAPDLLEACRFAKAHIKAGSPKKVLPILRAAISSATKGA